MWLAKLDTSDTIFALTTGPLPSAIAMLRLSGPRAFTIAEGLFTPRSGVFSRKREMWMGHIHDLGGNPIDDGLLLSFVAPHSHSGDDTIEFHLHGSLSVVRRLEEVLLQEGARPAERGEFSYRAFLNGKMSAGELDALGDVYLARQPADLSSLYSRKDGAMAAAISGLREHLIRLQALFDTAVDFSEEYSSVLTASAEPLEAAIHGCSAIIQRYSGFRTGGTSPRLVLAGRPNAGKSSLFNSLLGRYRAIVHSDPGTTRDVIEEELTVAGRTWKIVDTAGMRETEETREREGIGLGEAFLKASHAWLLVVDATEGVSGPERDLLERFRDQPHLVVWNKIDLPNLQPCPRDAVGVSATNGTGISSLWGKLQGLLQGVGLAHEGPLPTASECARLERVFQQLIDLKAELALNVPPEYLGEKNRQVLGHLEKVLGPVSSEDVLDRVFRDFCIGK